MATRRSFRFVARLLRRSTADTRWAAAVGIRASNGERHAHRLDSELRALSRAERGRDVSAGQSFRALRQGIPTGTSIARDRLPTRQAMPQRSDNRKPGRRPGVPQGGIDGARLKAAYCCTDRCDLVPAHADGEGSHCGTAYRQTVSATLQAKLGHSRPERDCRRVSHIVPSKQESNAATTRHGRRRNVAHVPVAIILGWPGAPVRWRYAAAELAERLLPVVDNCYDTACCQVSV
jgi:hypothetical protein